MTDRKNDTGTKEAKTMPVLVLPDTVLFPNCPHNFDIDDQGLIRELLRLVRCDRFMFIVSSDELDRDNIKFANIGVVANVTHMYHRHDCEVMQIQVMPKYRAYAEINLESERSCHMVNAYKAIELKDAEVDPMVKNLGNRIIHDIIPKVNAIEGRPNVDWNFIANGEITDFGCMLDSVADIYPFGLSCKQEMLNCLSQRERTILLYKAFKLELEFAKLDKQIENEVIENMDAAQREYYLREKLHVISEELGEGESFENESEEFIKRINELPLDESVRKSLLKECGKLAKLPFGSPEGAIIRGYLDVCLSIPWGKKTEDILDVSAVEKKLNHDHYGMDKVKERILELISVRALVPDIKGQIICLAGPPGVGKTSIARSIAEAMGRKYMRISLGGVRDEAEIRGHRKTYLGSMPGRVIDAIIKAEVINPLILLDEIDKLSSDYKGDPTSALLEVLDPEQNKAFVDHFVELSVDLSEVFFIATANDISAIPSPLYDRMEVIELPSYTHEEKAAIAKKYLVPKQMASCGLSSKILKISDTAIAKLIDDYTREAGVRNLEREIGSLCRKCAKKFVSGESEKISITSRNLESVMGKAKFKREELPESLNAGMANGLAWTSIGGEMLEIEVAVMEGSGKLELTGQLGDVMQESAKAAMTCVRQRAETLGIDTEYYKNNDIHIHVPEGAVPKDGPSAGITMATAIASALTGITVKGDIAMTGEITLGGRVLAIGGLREKSMAALRHGIKTVIIPAANEPDISEFSAAVKQNIKFVPVKKIDEVFDIAFSKPFKNND